MRSRARVVAAGVEADRVLEAGIVQSEPLGFAVHLPDEGLNAGFAPAADVLGQGVGGGAGGDHSSHQQLPDAQGVAGHEADVAVGRGREGCGARRDGSLLVEICPPSGSPGSHDLGGRGHRKPRRGIFSGQKLAAVQVRQRPRLRSDPRLLHLPRLVLQRRRNTRPAQLAGEERRSEHEDERKGEGQRGRR